jgi:hypothetical protein
VAVAIAKMEDFVSPIQFVIVRLDGLAPTVKVMLMNVIVHRVKMTEYVKTRRDLLNVIVKMVLPGSYVRMALIVVHQILVLMGYVRILWEVLSVNARLHTGVTSANTTQSDLMLVHI